MTGDDIIRLTYAELAEARGISLASARRMVHRHKWQKQVGNDGLSRILVPAEFTTRLESAGTGAIDDITRGVISDVINGASSEDTDDVTPGVIIGASSVRMVPLDEAVAAFAQVTTETINGATKGAIVTLQDAILSLRLELFGQRERADRAEKRVEELQRAMEEQAAEHRRVISELVTRIPERRSWWPWRR